MPSSTGYSWAPNGVVTPDSGLPTPGPSSLQTQWALGHYDFAVNGGAIGAISLLGAARVPAKSLVIGGGARVRTPLTSGGAATAALSIEAANDLIAAAVVTGAPWSTAGQKALIPLFGTPGTWLPTTVARDLVLTVAVAALTAGVVDFYVAYIPLLA